jgi:hypothetical protein
MFLYIFLKNITCAGGNASIQISLEVRSSNRTATGVTDFYWIHCESYIINYAGVVAICIILLSFEDSIIIIFI